MAVSVVIPAYNAQATLAKTLESLLAQTYGEWEAIVVDDGSADDTVMVASVFAKKDARIHLLKRPHAGVSSSRNAGLAAAQGEWLLFLDSDDWIAPTHLEKLIAKLQAEPELDAVYCRWAFVAENGVVFEWKRPLRQGDLFPSLACGCVFPIHSCLVRLSLLQGLGGFDTSLRTCEDWDLWQRAARSGARFGAITDILSFYRMRPHSASTNGRRMLEDGLRVINQGHACDSRVARPLPKHSAGAPSAQLPMIKLHMAAYTGGLILGAGGDPLDLFSLLDPIQPSALDPESISQSLLEAVLVPMAKAPGMWHEVYAEVAPRIQQLLQALEARSTTPDLARCVTKSLERQVLQYSYAALPLTIGSTRAIRIEVTEPIPSIDLEASIERLYVVVEAEGSMLGQLEMPVCDGRVPADVLSDAIAAAFAWPILGRFFKQTLYPQLEWTPEGSGMTLKRNGLPLAEGVAGEKRQDWEFLHDQVGWTLFLQELWGHPDWQEIRFYSPEGCDAQDPNRLRLENDQITVEVSATLPNAEISSQAVGVTVRIGGVTLGFFTLPTAKQLISGAELCSAITGQAGFELCRAAVREGLLGRPFHAQPTQLRERLAASAGKAAVALEDCSIVFARRIGDAFDSSASRRAQLPYETLDDLLEAAQAAHEPVSRKKVQSGTAITVRYEPSLLTQSPLKSKTSDPQPQPVTQPESPRIRQLPILMYHQMNTSNSAAMRYSIRPSAFEEQLRYLRDNGYASINFEEWAAAMRARRALSGRHVLITFDDGYSDFNTHAWPLLKRYGFSATVFLVGSAIGGNNTWDSAHGGGQVSLMGWEEIRALQAEGVKFESHAWTHRPMAALTPVEIVQESARSRAALQRQLQKPVRAIAYPYGITDKVVGHLAGACGYLYGVTTEARLAELSDHPLAMPRLEITGQDTLQDFIAKLSPTA